MSFIEILPSRNRSSVFMGDKVKASIIQKSSKQVILRLSIGYKWLKQLGISPEKDTIIFMIDDAEPLLWGVKKAVDSQGWKLVTQSNKRDPAYYYIQITWKHPIPEVLNSGPRFIPHVDIYEGYLRLGLPGLQAKEFQL